MQLINALRGRKLQHFCCEAEILDFDFGTLTLHAMGCSRVIKNNDILVTVLSSTLNPPCHISNIFLWLLFLSSITENKQNSQNLLQ